MVQVPFVGMAGSHHVLVGASGALLLYLEYLSIFVLLYTVATPTDNGGQSRFSA